MARLNKLEVDLTGPFFQRDPRKTVRGNIRQMLEGVAEEGERTVKSASPVLTGAFRAGVKGRVRSLGGKRWELTAVVSQTHVYPWSGGGSKQYRGGKAEARYQPFKRTANALRRSRAVLAANLTEGLE